VDTFTPDDEGGSPRDPAASGAPLEGQRRVLSGPSRFSASSGLFVLALLYTAYVARPILLPTVIAGLLSFVLRAPVSGLRRLRVPRTLAAAMVVGGVCGALGYGAVSLSGPALRWAEEAPRSLSLLEHKLRRIKKPVEDVQKATEQVEKMADVGKDGTPKVVVKGSSLGTWIFSGTGNTLAQILLTLVLTFFFLAYGDALFERAVGTLPRTQDRDRLFGIGEKIRHEITIYLFTITVINVCLGIAISGAMAAVGMPNPVLWGAVTGLLNFIPYAGAVVSTGVVAVVALLTFQDMGRIVAAPVALAAITALEGQVVTPMILGRRLALNPVVILIGLLLWGWLWGVPGALVAVPLLVSFKIIADRTPSLRALGKVLGTR
jgi:predicted PurR-regulated permease PerM